MADRTLVGTPDPDEPARPVFAFTTGNTTWTGQVYTTAQVTSDPFAPFTTWTIA